MYTVNKIRDSIPPCRTPLTTVKEEDNVPFHRTWRYWQEYHWIKNRNTECGSLRCNNRSNKWPWSTMSIALLMCSSAHLTLAPRCTYCEATIFSIPVHRSVEHPFLKPNCNPDVLKPGFSAENQRKGGEGVRAQPANVGGSGGMPPRKILNSRCSEIVSGGFWDPISLTKVTLGVVGIFTKCNAIVHVQLYNVIIVMCSNINSTITPRTPESGCSIKVIVPWWRPFDWNPQ